jgi:hypothetical protein
VLDFASIPSAVLSKATSVTITLYETVAGASSANIYGTNTDPATTLQSVTTIPTDTPDVSITGISLNNGGTLSPNTFTLNSTGAYDYYVVDVTTNGAGCGVVVTDAQLNFPNTPTPEPGTFVMAGVALLGLGVTLKKRVRKS